MAATLRAITTRC